MINVTITVYCILTSGTWKNSPGLKSGVPDHAVSVHSSMSFSRKAFETKSRCTGTRFCVGTQFVRVDTQSCQDIEGLS